jgi:hypothetical protein
MVFQERENKDFSNDQTFSCRHVYRPAHNEHSRRELFQRAIP